MLVSEAKRRLGLESFMDHQREAFFEAQAATEQLRFCLYYRTGAGKSITSLVMMALVDVPAVLVVAPPSTHPEWRALGVKLGMVVETISHAKFRQPAYKMSRKQALIVDEFHLLGGHNGKGWKKMDRLAAGLQAPMLILSATPNYNDAERVYCIQHVLDPASCRGGFLEFLYKNCETEQDPFSMIPKVNGFLHHPDAASYLAAMPGVLYVEDDLEYVIEDHHVDTPIEPEIHRLSYDPVGHKMIASDMERRHLVANRQLTRLSRLRTEVRQVLTDVIPQQGEKILIFCNHATIAEATHLTLKGIWPTRLITGATGASLKEQILRDFKGGVHDFKILVGTASLATGTDGLDKVCDHLIILDDTDDDSLRRQLVGRIMPRGLDSDTSNKRVHRIVCH